MFFKVDYLESYIYEEQKKIKLFVLKSYLTLNCYFTYNLIQL